MLKRLLRILLPGAALLVLVLLARRTMSLRHELDPGTVSPDPWTPIPTRSDPAPAPNSEAPAAEAEVKTETWVVANEDGSCPPTHHIKAKATSGLYHLPGMVFYNRTKPDRCYADESAAVADGFTKSKR